MIHFVFFYKYCSYLWQIILIIKLIEARNARKGTKII